MGLGYDCKHVIEEAEAINVAMDSEKIAKKLSQALTIPVKQSLEAGNDSHTRLEVCPIIIFLGLYTSKLIKLKCNIIILQYYLIKLNLDHPNRIKANFKESNCLKISCSEASGEGKTAGKRNGSTSK